MLTAPRFQTEAQCWIDMEGRAGSISPGPDQVYNSQEEDVGSFLAQYGGVSLSQGSMGQMASDLSQPGLQSQSLQGSPQRSPYHRSPRPSRHAHIHSPSHHPHSHSTPPHQASPGRSGGFEAGGNVASTSWANIPAAATAKEEGETIDLKFPLVTRCKIFDGCPLHFKI